MPQRFKVRAGQLLASTALLSALLSVLALPAHSAEQAAVQGAPGALGSIAAA